MAITIGRCPLREVPLYWTGGLDRTVGTNLVSEGGMSNGRPMDVHWTGGLDRTVGTSLVSEGGMSNGRPMDVHWTGGLDRTVGQAWSVRVGCPMDVPWMSIGQVDWTGQWDKPGQ